MLSVVAVLVSGPARAQTPGQVPVFNQPGTGSCNAAGTNDCIDSAITQDASGNIGIGTTAPAAKLHVAGGNLFLESSTATSGNIIKGGNLFLHDSGPVNTFMGSGAGNLSVTGDTNVGIGFSALANLTSGFSNTAVGGFALSINSSGHTNTAVGQGALQSNTVGYENTATGLGAMFSNDSGSFNTADGVNALQSNFNGNRNVAMGEHTLVANSSGNANVAIGVGALSQASGNNNIAIGDASGSGSNNIYIADLAHFSSESNSIHIGDPQSGGPFFAAGIANTAVSGLQVMITGDNQLGVMPSSRRFKEEIHDMGDASALLRKLRPVGFYYTPDVQAGPRQLNYGLIAEEVASVYPELVEYSATGEPFSVRYQVLDAMLLNELQRRHRQLEERQREIQAQAGHIADLQAQIAAIAGQHAAKTVQTAAGQSSAGAARTGSPYRNR
jgi:hypothetical protein